jgi:hypothetical protein
MSAPLNIISMLFSMYWREVSYNSIERWLKHTEENVSIKEFPAIWMSG